MSLSTCEIIYWVKISQDNQFGGNNFVNWQIAVNGFFFGKLMDTLIIKHENSDVIFYFLNIHGAKKITQALTISYNLAASHSHRTCKNNVICLLIINRVLIYPLKWPPPP